MQNHPITGFVGEGTKTHVACKDSLHSSSGTFTVEQIRSGLRMKQMKKQ